MNKMNLKLSLVRACKIRNIKESDVAKKLNFTRQYLNAILSGRKGVSQISLVNLQRVIDAVGMKPSTFIALGESDEKELNLDNFYAEVVSICDSYNKLGDE